MKDEHKTKKQLIKELKKAREQISKFEKLKHEWKETEITKGKQAGIRIEKELTAITSVMNDMLSREVDDAQTEARILDVCLSATDSAYGMIGKINEHGKFDTTTYNSQTLQDCAFPEALTWEMSTGMTIRGILGWPMLNGKPLICNDLKKHADRVGLPKGHVLLHCFLGVPLIIDGKVAGMVAVANKPRGYTQENQDTLIRLASVISLSREHHMALKDAKRTNEELEQIVVQRTKALKKSEEKYRTLTGNINIGIYRSTPGPKGKYLEVNPAMIEIFGYESKEELLKVPPASIYQNPEDRKKFSNKLLRKGFVQNEELKLKKKDGIPIIGSTTAIAVKSLNGKVLYFDGIVDDITSQKIARMKLKNSLKEKEILLQEIHHRVKNNLMVIIGLFHFYSSGIKNEKVENMLTNIENTIRSMALIHEKLYQSTDLGRINFKFYVNELIYYLISLYKLDPSLFKLEVDIGKIFLNLQTAIPCGMIINELISNIMKHAFPQSLIDQRIKSGEKGNQPCHIYVKLIMKRKTVKSSKPIEYRLIIKDNGVGLTEDLYNKNTKSKGLSLVNMMVKQLDGKLEVYYKDGTIFTIDFKEH